MRRKFAELQLVECNEPITAKAHLEFVDHLQWSLLLTLRERGRLNPVQYFRAEEILKEQRLRQARPNFEIK